MIFSCKQVTRLVSDEMERPLSFRERAGMRFHLLICSACRAYRRQVVGLANLLRKKGALAGKADPAVTLAPEAKERLTKAIMEKTSGK